MMSGNKCLPRQKSRSLTVYPDRNLVVWKHSTNRGCLGATPKACQLPVQLLECVPVSRSTVATSFSLGTCQCIDWLAAAVLGNYPTREYCHGENWYIVVVRRHGGAANEVHIKMRLSGDDHTAPQIDCVTFNDCNVITVTLEALHYGRHL